MAAVRKEDVIEELSMDTTEANVPLMFEPITTAPVYLIGNFAAIPYMLFWKIPPATVHMYKFQHYLFKIYFLE